MARQSPAVSDTRNRFTAFVTEVLQHIAATLTIAIGGAIIAGLGIAKLDRVDDPKEWPTWVLVTVGLIILLLFSANSIRLAVSGWRRRRAVRAAAGDRIAVLIPQFDGDADNSLRETVRDTIKRELGETIDIVRWTETLRLSDGHDQDAERAAQAIAQTWLKKNRCDIAVWGRVKATGVVSLRFTVAEQNTTPPESYVLTGETFELSRKFITDLGTAIVASVLTSVNLARDRGGEYIAPQLTVAADRLKPVATHPNPSFDADSRGSLLHSYGLIRSVLASQTGAVGDFEAAIAAYREALNDRPRERVPMEWARTWGNMGRQSRLSTMR